MADTPEMTTIEEEINPIDELKVRRIDNKILQLVNTINNYVMMIEREKQTLQEWQDKRNALINELITDKCNKGSYSRDQVVLDVDNSKWKLQVPKSKEGEEKS